MTQTAKVVYQWNIIRKKFTAPKKIISKMKRWGWAKITMSIIKPKNK